ncbi:MAG: DNA-processing protein DprA [Xanthobacteraceae bacterium]
MYLQGDLSGGDPAGRQLTDAERLDWVRLIRTEHVGPRTFLTLLRRYGSARAALAAVPDLARRGGATRPPRIVSSASAEAEVASAIARGLNIVALGESDYPRRLAVIDGAPPLIAVQGKAASLAGPIVAIVGGRNASAAGLQFAERLGRDLGNAGFTIASGLARGIDAAAHRASLATGTVAVLAGGHDRIYPPENLALAKSITAEGALISEMPLGWEPRARDFPRRNRLISGLAAGVVVIEAARRSGSLITARYALEQGREVFAVPGSPLDPRAEGSNNLLKDGATLVTEAEDVAAVLRPILGQTFELALAEPEPVQAQGADPPSDERSRILQLLGPTPVAVDELVRHASSTPAVVRIVLLELELARRIERHGGSLVSTCLTVPS